ncbi:hypothetical protein Tco_1509846 [Tanacetum coccineum]
MEISIADQIALDDALVAPADRLKIGKCNLRLSSDVTSKEATLQVVYDVLKLTPFYKAFQVTADAPEIYMQELWASAYVHNRSVRFKMNNKKHILDLDQFRDILQICPKVGNKKFEEPPLEKEILAFLASLDHLQATSTMYRGKPSYDSLHLSQAQILWGMYNKKKVDYAYLLWEDFTYQIENKNTKKGSLDVRNKVNWHYARDDPMFTTINVISRNEDTQLYGAILPTELTNEDIRISESYKEYHAIASGKIPPKTKGSKKKADTDTTTKMKPPTVPKEKKERKSGKGKQKATELETISEAILTEAEQLKIITKRSRKETHSFYASRFLVQMKELDDEDDDYHERDRTLKMMYDEAQTKSEDDEPSFSAPTNHPPTPILSLKSLEDNFSELRQTNQYAEALSSIPGIVDHYLANKMQEAVDVAVQLKYDRIREESNTENQQFLDSIDEGMKKVIKEQVKKEVSKITPKIEKLVNEQLESEVLVRSSKEAKTSHAVAANLSELELKKILIDKMEANNSINRSDIQRQLYKALVDAYEADKILLDT